MAGMRIGCAYGHGALIRRLNDVKYSFNSYTMNIPSLVLGEKVLEDNRYFKETLEKIMCTRETAKKRLKELGFSFPDSMANFIFASHKERSAEEIYMSLREKNIFVRYFKQPRIDNYLRITIGTDEEMEALYGFLKEYL